MNTSRNEEPPPPTWLSIWNVITFKLARESPWLTLDDDYGIDGKKEEEDDDEGAEEEKCLLRNQQRAHEPSRLFSLTSVMNFLFAASTLRRAGAGSLKSQVQLDFALGQVSLFAASKWRKLAGRAICALFIVMISYSALKVGTSLVYIFRHDTIMTKMQPKLISSANHQVATQQLQPNGQLRDKCARKQDIAYGVGFSWPEFVETNRKLDSIGLPNKSQPGASFLSIAIIFSAPLAFYCLPLVYVYRRRHQIRLDSITFLYDPVGERRRLLADLRAIMHELAETFELNGGQVGGCCSAASSCLRAPEARRWTLRRRGPARGQLVQRPACELDLCVGAAEPPLASKTTAACCPGQTGERVAFLELLSEIKRRQLVRPVVISSKWQCDLEPTCRLMAITFTLISSLCPLASMFSFCIADLVVRVQERATHSACTRWHPDAVLLKPNLYLGPDHLFLSHEERKAYESYENGANPIFQLARLVFYYELSRVWCWRTIAYALRLQLITIFLSFWSTFWTLIYVISFLGKISWLLQIRAQLADCRQQVAASLATCAHDPLLLNKRCAHSDQLVRKLTIAYANYELFRRQYRPFRCLSNFLVFQACVFSASGFLAAYLIATSIETKFKLLAAFTALAILLFMNGYLLVSSLASKFIESIVQQLARLLALMANYPELGAKPTLEMWRRQLVSEAEVRLLASTQLMTLHISYKRIIALNVQLFALLLLVWRTFGPRAHEFEAARATSWPK